MSSWPSSMGDASPASCLLTSGVEAAMLRDCRRMKFSVSGRDNLGIAKVLRLYLSWHPPVNDFVEAKRAFFSPTTRPQGALLRHEKSVLVATRCHAPRQPPQNILRSYPCWCEHDFPGISCAQLAMRIIAPGPASLARSSTGRPRLSAPACARLHRTPSRPATRQTSPSAAVPDAASAPFRRALAGRIVHCPRFTASPSPSRRLCA